METEPRLGGLGREIAVRALRAEGLEIVAAEELAALRRLAEAADSWDVVARCRPYANGGPVLEALDRALESWRLFTR